VTDVTPTTGGGKTIFGHPRGLVVLFFAEMWERFSYYGMRALLVLFLVQHFLMSQDEASATYAAYAALVYLLPIVGGVIADRWLGARKAVTIGALLLVAGHFAMAFEGSGGQQSSPSPARNTRSRRSVATPIASSMPSVPTACGRPSPSRPKAWSGTRRCSRRCRR